MNWGWNEAIVCGGSTVSGHDGEAHHHCGVLIILV